MSGDEPIRVIKGKPWFNYTLLASAVVLAASGTLAYADQRSGKADIIRRLDERDKHDAVYDTKIDNINTNLSALSTRVDDALRDPWTGTDTKFWGQEQLRFWSDFARLNPSITITAWPEPKRIRPDDDLRTDSRK